jgi:adenine/guanine phosphoribosyltransferase-like PRPP-binding protein
MITKSGPDPRSQIPNFTVHTPIPAKAHVLVIDDTWTGGGHAQSAALALRAAGAQHVSILALARWLAVGWEATTSQWMTRHLSSIDYNPAICPWTRTHCP